MAHLDRYPGIHSFKAKDQDRFFGRDDDKRKLFQSILLNQVTVIVGRSGIGKSSLINAGLLPKLYEDINQNERDIRNFRLLSIRVGHRKENEDLRLLEKVLQTKITNILSTEAEEDERNTGNTFISFLPEAQKKTLWYKFKQHQFQDRLNQKKFVYLFLFDQLEELFSYPGDEFNELVKAIAELINPNPPDAVREAIYEQTEKDEHSLSEEDQNVLETPVPIKFLFAIRSDKIGLLLRLRDAIPDILQNPYELRPLSKEQAKQAIVKPTELKNGFKKKFTFQPEAVEIICDKLNEAKSADPEMKFETRRIQPFALQIICSHIEKNLGKIDKNKDGLIEAAEVIKVIEKPYKEFYFEVLKKLKATNEMLLRIRTLIEEKFIDAKNECKRIVNINEINEAYITQEFIKRLEKHRLLREVTGLGIAAYEISHDFLLQPILQAKEQRLQEEERRGTKIYRVQDTLDKSLGNLEEAIQKNPNDYNSYKRLGDYYCFLQEFEKAVTYYTEAINKKESLNILGGTLELYYNRGDCYSRLGQYERSISDFDIVLSIEPGHLLANLYNGFNYQKLESWERSTEYYKRVISADKNYGIAYYNLGIVLRQLKSFEKSKECFLRTVELDPNDFEAYHYLGLIAVDLSEFDQAITYFDQVLALKPEYTAAYEQKAMIYAKQNQNDLAFQCYRNILRINPQHADTYYNLGILYKRMKKIPEAQKHFLEAARLNPNDFESYYNLGVIANDLKQYDDAIPYLDKSLQLNDRHVNSYIEKGFSLSQQYRDEEALQTYLQVLQIDPDNMIAKQGLEMIKGENESPEQLLQKVKNNPKDFLAWYKLGVQFNNNRQFEKAIDSFKKALKLKPYDVNTLIEMAYAYNYSGDEGKSIDCYEKILKIEPRNVLAISSQARVYYTKRNYNKARDFFTKATELEPDDYTNFYYLGVIANNEKEFGVALSHFEKGLELNPLHKNCLVGKGYVLNQLGRLEESVSCYRQITEIDPAYSEGFASLGILYSKLGNTEEAEKNYLQAVKLNGRDYESYYDLGTLADKKKDYLKAIGYFEKAIEIKPDFIKAYDYLAYYYMQLQDYDKAASLYQLIIEKTPEYSNAYYNLGNIQVQLQNIPEALKYLKKAIELNPNDHEACRQIGILYKQMNRPEEAAHYLQIADRIEFSNQTAVKDLEPLQSRL